jgi:hypothetical protein
LIDFSLSIVNTLKVAKGRIKHGFCGVL